MACCASIPGRIANGSVGFFGGLGELFGGSGGLFGGSVGLFGDPGGLFHGSGGLYGGYGGSVEELERCGPSKDFSPMDTLMESEHHL